MSMPATSKGWRRASITIPPTTTISALVETNRMPKLSELVGGQDWADEMPCLIILCAMLERTMWKYDDPNAYRVVLIEAGHIGQNIMLAATRNGLSACPTAALNHTTIRECVGLKRLTDAPVYALTLAVPGAETGSRRISLQSLYTRVAVPPRIACWSAAGSEAIAARCAASEIRVARPQLLDGEVLPKRHRSAPNTGNGLLHDEADMGRIVAVDEGSETRKLLTTFGSSARRSSRPRQTAMPASGRGPRACRRAAARR